MIRKIPSGGPEFPQKGPFEDIFKTAPFQNYQKDLIQHFTESKIKDPRIYIQENHREIGKQLVKLGAPKSQINEFIDAFEKQLHASLELALSEESVSDAAPKSRSRRMAKYLAAQKVQFQILETKSLKDTGPTNIPLPDMIPGGSSHYSNNIQLPSGYAQFP